MERNLRKGSSLILSHQEPVHRDRGCVYQIDRLAISEQKEREAPRVVPGQRNQVSALSFITERAVNLDQRPFQFIDDADPGHAPAPHCKLVRSDLMHLRYQVVREEEFLRLGELLVPSVVRSEKETSGAGQSIVIL